ncbi:MAG: aminotransferase class I/II-fold pyridoxal phosphate-dependent enzyme [Lachnospiraceae bacterium]
MRFAKRMQKYQTGIFSELLEIKNEKLAEGKRIIDLSVGTPNIPPAEHIKQALCDAAFEDTNYIYAIHDTTQLQDAVVEWYLRRYQVALDGRTQVCSLLGSQEGLAHIALALVDPGEIVLVQDPCYPVFADGPGLMGAQLYYMPQRKEKQYLVDVTEIPAEVARQARLMISSYPNNPTTAMAPDSFYEEMIAFAKANDIMIVHDNAYSELVFDGNRGKSFLSYPGAEEVGVEFNSLSKTYGLAGARCGFCVGNAEIVGVVKALKSNIDYGMFLPIQKAAIAAITQDQSCVAETRQAYEHRRNVLCEGFQKIGWPMEKPAATMFVWAPIPAHYASSMEFVRDMIEKAGVIVTPGSAFGQGGEGFVRLALVQDEQVIQEAIEAVRKSGILENDRVEA